MTTIHIRRGEAGQRTRRGAAPRHNSPRNSRARFAPPAGALRPRRAPPLSRARPAPPRRAGRLVARTTLHRPFPRVAPFSAPRHVARRVSTEKKGARVLGGGEQRRARALPQMTRHGPARGPYRGNYARCPQGEGGALIPWPAAPITFPVSVCDFASARPLKAPRRTSLRDRVRLRGTPARGDQAPGGGEPPGERQTPRALRLVTRARK